MFGVWGHSIRRRVLPLVAVGPPDCRQQQLRCSFSARCALSTSQLTAVGKLAISLSGPLGQIAFGDATIARTLTAP